MKVKLEGKLLHDGWNQVCFSIHSDRFFTVLLVVMLQAF